MFCVKAPRELRNKKSQHSALAASDCWGNISVLVGTTARACGFSSDTTLCKKHIDESINNVNKVSCCVPFRGPENTCKDALVLCPQRLFSVFDETKTVHHWNNDMRGSLRISSQRYQNFSNGRVHFTNKGGCEDEKLFHF